MNPPDSHPPNNNAAQLPASVAVPVAPAAAWSAGVLGWSAWQRLLAVAPLLLLLWLAVAWALPEAALP